MAHSSDFSILIPVLEKLFVKYKNIELEVIGDVSNSEFFNKFSDRILVTKLGDYKFFLDRVSQSDINLVPLVDNEFNKSKSNIKFIDASIVKTCTVATNIGDYSLINKNTIKLVKTENEWMEELSDLIENNEKRLNLANNAFIYVNKKYVSSNFIDKLKFTI